MKKRKSIAILVVLSLLFSLLTGVSFAETAEQTQGEVQSISQVGQEVLQTTEDILRAETAPQKAYVRIEGDSDSFIPKTEVAIDDFDLESYGITKTKPGFVAIQAVVKALEESGLDPKDPEVLVHNGGSFITNVCGLEQGGVSGWMYAVNDQIYMTSINDLELKAEDEVVLYFIQDYQKTAYAYFDKEKVGVESGQAFELTLQSSSIDMYTGHTTLAPCEGAQILVDGSEMGVTDANGKISLTLDEVGTHYISAQKIDDSGVNCISRPYCEAEISESTTERVKMTALKITPAARKLSPDFDMNRYSYEMELPSNVSSFYTYPTLEEESAEVVAMTSWSDKVLSRTNTGAIAISDVPPGESTIKYYIQPADEGKKGATYTIHINRLMSSNANLNSLKLSSGTVVAFRQSTATYKDGTLYQCTYDEGLDAYVPTSKKNYSKTVQHYYAQVNYYIDKLCFSAKLDGDTPMGYGKIEISNETTGEKISTTSEVVSPKLSLKEGENKLVLTATSQDGTSQMRYDLTVIRLNEVGINNIQIEEGYIEAISTGKGVSNIYAQIPEEFTQFTLTITANEGNVITLEDKTINSGEPIVISDIGTKSSLKKNITVSCGEITSKYTLNVYRHNPLSASYVEEYVAAPGQYQSGVHNYVLNADATLRQPSSFISLGGYGGYVTYAFEDEIQNSDTHPYGIDFIIYGNSNVNGSSSYYKGTTVSFAEPGAVMVAEDDGTGKPATWYQLAPSNYYENNVIKNYSRTYTKSTNGYAVETDNKGNLEGIANHKYLYPRGDIYNCYPSFGTDLEAVGENELTLPGGYGTENGIFLIGTDEVVSSGEHQFAPEDLTFGYADVHINGSGNKATNPYRDPAAVDYWKATNGDGFDLDWAVDENGKPVHLDQVKFVKVYTASGYLSTFGEKSTEITKILRAAEEGESVGTTSDLEKLVITSKDSEENSYQTEVTLKAGVYEYILPIEGEKISEIKAESSPMPENIFIGKSYAPDGKQEVSYLLGSDNVIRVIAQDGKKQPIIYLFKFTQKEPAIKFDVEDAIASSQEWLKKNVNFETASYAIGSTPDWSAFSLAVSNEEVPKAYYLGMRRMINSYETAEAFKQKVPKVTEYERMTLGLTAAGYDATSLAGVNFIEAIYNNKDLTSQGVNGICYGLLAVDSHHYEVPEDALYTRDKMVDALLERHIEGEGWSNSGKESNEDLTAMVIQALAPYYLDTDYSKNEAVRKVVDEAIIYLSGQQRDDGTYVSSETMAQVMTALASLKIDPDKDERFIKKGHTLIQAFGMFYVADQGGFKHLCDDEGTNRIATEQALYALAAYQNNKKGSHSIYDLSALQLIKEEPVKNIIIEDHDEVTIEQEVKEVTFEIPGAFHDVKLDIQKVKENLPEMTIKFGANEIYCPRGLRFNESVNELCLTACLPSQLENYKAQFGEIESISEAFDFGNDKKLTFNDYITLTFKGKANEEAAYIDELGKLHHIIKSPESTKDLSEYCLVSGNDLLIKTSHLTTFLVYTKKGQSDKDPEEDHNKINITISVDAKTIGLGYLVSPLTIEVKKKSTVYDALESLGLKLTTTGDRKNIYIAGINDIFEFEHGLYSGWLYQVNGHFPNKSMGSYYLDEGDCIEICYTTNGGKDISEEAAILFKGMGNGDSSYDYKEMMKVIRELQKNKETLTDWEIIACARQGELKKQVKEKLLSSVKEEKGTYRKVTDLERTILALGAAGYDAQNIEGLNLIQKLYQNEELTKQGVNGVIFALIALDSRQYPVPQEALWTREKLITLLLTYQNEAGGFALSIGGEENVDLTAMALTALAPYKQDKKVRSSIEKAIAYLEKAQNKQGGFNYNGVQSSESVAQVIIALTTLGIDPTTDQRFIKDERNLMDVLGSYYVEGEGFSHVQGGEVNEMATEQGSLALYSYYRYVEKQSSIYTYATVEAPIQLEIVNEDLLSDFSDHDQVAKWAVADMNEAIKLGLIEGNNGMLKPTDEITRAEFVKLLLKVMGQEEAAEETHFKDVPRSAWYCNGVNTAYQLGLIQGESENLFYPQKNLTREQMAVIIDRLLEVEGEEKKPLDLQDTASWATNAVMHMYAAGIMEGSEEKFNPKKPVSRQMAVVIIMRVYDRIQNKEAA